MLSLRVPWWPTAREALTGPLRDTRPTFKWMGPGKRQAPFMMDCHCDSVNKESGTGGTGRRGSSHWRF
eukprot:7312412-Heterocapsa_arctica.AAC.1